MPRRLLALFGSVCLVLILAALPFMTACPAPAQPPTQPEEETTPTISPEEGEPTPSAWEWPSTITIMVTGIGTGSYTAAAAWAPELEQMTGSTVRLLPEESGPTKIKMLKEGVVDFIIDAASDWGQFCIEGREGYATREAGPFQIRIVGVGTLQYRGFFVRGDSALQTIYDIKAGTRLANLQPVPAFAGTLDALCAWVQIDPEDVVYAPFGSMEACIRSVGEGKADVCWANCADPTVFEVGANPQGIRWLPLPAQEDPEGANRFLNVKPVVSFGLVEAGHETAIGTPGVIMPWLIAATADTDPELVYHLSKWLDENYDTYKSKHITAELTSINHFRSVLDTIFLPVHDGTIRYLKEKNMWTPADDARQEYNVNLVTRYVEAYEDAIALADDRGIEIDPSNDAWVDLWKSYKEELNIPAIRVMIEIP